MAYVQFSTFHRGSIHGKFLPGMIMAHSQPWRRFSMLVPHILRTVAARVSPMGTVWYLGMTLSTVLKTPPQRKKQPIMTKSPPTSQLLNLRG